MLRPVFLSVLLLCRIEVAMMNDDRLRWIVVYHSFLLLYLNFCLHIAEGCAKRSDYWLQYTLLLSVL